jgi:hypothetical protein
LDVKHQFGGAIYPTLAQFPVASARKLRVSVYASTVLSSLAHIRWPMHAYESPDHASAAVTERQRGPVPLPRKPAPWFNQRFLRNSSDD